MTYLWIILAILIVLLLITLYLTFLSPFKKNIGLSPQDVSVIVGNVAPTIVSITPISNVILNSGTTKDVTVIFTAEDLNGASDLNDATASVSFTKSGEATRTSVPITGCSAGAPSGNQKTYTCTVTMQYYDGFGTWNVQVSIQDQATSTTQLSSTFDVDQLFSTSNTASISFGTVSPGQNDIISLTDTTITNNGNVIGALKVLANNLKGVTNPLELIPASNFNAAGSSQAATVCTTGTALANALSTTITSSNLPRGQSGSNTETLRYCLDVPGGISTQTYSTTAPGGIQWAINL